MRVGYAPILLVGMGVAFLTWISSYIAGNFYLSSAFLFLITLATVYGSALKKWMLPGLIINVAAILSIAWPPHSQAINQRIVLILVITMILLLLQGISNYSFRKKNVIKLNLKRCGKLLDEIFACYLQRDYSAKYIEYEMRIRNKCNAVIQSIGYLKENKKSERLVQRFERLYEIILSLGSMRYRVKDHTIFEITATELGQISACLDSMFNHPDNLHMVEQLQEDIFQLEQVNQTALEVIAPDPLVFLLFIHELKTLQIELQQFRVLYEEN